MIQWFTLNKKTGEFFFCQTYSFYYIFHGVTQNRDWISPPVYCNLIEIVTKIDVYIQNHFNLIILFQKNMKGKENKE